jgi:hypothetical protein
MREWPIIFSGPMVNAILDGRKTQTRRVVKPQPIDLCPRSVWKAAKAHPDMPDPSPSTHLFLSENGQAYGQRCPYGAPGDRLWVREAWGIGSRPDPWGGYDGIEYRADEAWLEDGDYLPCYKVATPDDVCLGDYRAGWHPSIHMPRWASRITLEVTGVRVERLQAISEKDAIAEGAPGYEEGVDAAPPDSDCEWSYRASFRRLWERINGAGSWDTQPWVWVVEFQRVEAKESE